MDTVSIRDHLSSHYCKINNAKAAVDTAPPVAMVKGIKARDRARKAGSAASSCSSSSSSSRLYSRASCPATLAGNLRQVYIVNPAAMRSNLVHTPSASRSSLRERPSSSTTTLRGGALYTGALSADARLWTRDGARRGRCCYRDVSYQRGVSGSADLLSKAAHRFTQPRAFTPRTLLRDDTASRLAGMSCYNRPRATGRAAAAAAAAVARRGEKEEDVPPLDIRRDTDHLMWLEEQASHARSRQAVDPSRRPLNTTADSSYSNGYISATKSPAGRKIQEAEEELSYLGFVTDVTTDILARGIFTNKILKQVFQHHVHKQKGRLKLSRLRELITQLQDDLGIPESENSDDEGVGLGSTSPRGTPLWKKGTDSTASLTWRRADNPSSSIIDMSVIDRLLAEEDSNDDGGGGGTFRSANNQTFSVEEMNGVANGTAMEGTSANGTTRERSTANGTVREGTAENRTSTEGTVVNRTTTAEGTTTNGRTSPGTSEPRALPLERHAAPPKPPPRASARNQPAKRVTTASSRPSDGAEGERRGDEDGRISRDTSGGATDYSVEAFEDGSDEDEDDGGSASDSSSDSAAGAGASDDDDDDDCLQSGDSGDGSSVDF